MSKKSISVMNSKRQERSSSQDSDIFDDPVGERVHVYVRIRPLVQSDARCFDGKGAVGVADVNLTQVSVLDGKRQKTFQFDQVLPPDASNEEVYHVVGKPLVEASMTGLNSILMAYGQTGAGKTHTLMASDGLTANVVTHIFALVNRDAAHSYAVTCSYLQIYQERVYDLLGDDKSGAEVYLREHPKKGVYVENLSEYFVKCPEEICRLLKSGKKRLAIAETKMNRQSSRSHAICLLKIERLSVPRRYGGISDSLSSYESYYVSGPSDVEYSSDGGSLEAIGPYVSDDEDDEMLSRIASQTRGRAAVRGKLYVCDLAGSERVKKTQAEGERLQEAQSINSSLLELGNVIHALAEGKKRHIPYRNSTLTRLLQDGLDGNSKTSLIICVSPSCRDVNETLCSLKFGLRAMKVPTVAQVNVEINYEKMAKQLSETLEEKEREWRRLKTEYESYIMTLEAERDVQRGQDTDQAVKHSDQLDSPSRGSNQRSNYSTTFEDEALKNQTKAVLLAELVSMELFYGLEDLLREGTAGVGQAFSSDKLYGLTDRDLLLHSAETLLELTEYFFTRSTLHGDDAARTTGLDTTHTPNEKAGLTSKLLTQECARHSTPISDSSYSRKLVRVKETLCRLKKTTDSAALSFFSSLLDTKHQQKGEDEEHPKRRLHELLRDLLKCGKSSPGDNGNVIDSWKLEQSLCHVLLDKALLNCLLLLDKADMETRMKTFKVQHNRFDYSGINSMTPVQLDCSSQSGDDIPPSPPLLPGRPGEGRLVSVDEGVVLESSSDSTNSREKLPVHFESGVEELEAENKLLRQTNEIAENEKSDLTLKVLELERKLKRSEQKLANFVRVQNSGEVKLSSKMEEKEFEAQELLARVDELEDELRLSEETVVTLKESDKRMRSQLSGEKRRAEAAEQQRSKLLLKIRQLEDKLEESELKLASYTGSDFLENNKIVKQLESAITENTELNVRILRLEEKLKESCNDSSNGEKYLHCDGQRSGENQAKVLDRTILDLEGKLKEQDVKIASVKEYERRLRAELCKEMTKKLTRAQTRSRELGEKILELETRLRETRMKGLDADVPKAASEDIQALTSKLEDTETRNQEPNSKLQDNVHLPKQSEISLRERVQSLELENCKLQDKILVLKEKSKRDPCSRTAGRLEKARNENSNLALELKSFRENLLKLEGQLLEKDQEILSLRNDSVDLSSDINKLRAELDDSLAEKCKLMRQLARRVEEEQSQLVKMSAMQEEIEKLRPNAATTVSEVTRVTESLEKNSEPDCKSDSTVSTVLIEEKYSEAAAKNVDHEEALPKAEERETSEEERPVDVNQLLRENKSLHVVIHELGNENSRIAKLNEQLVHDIKTLETSLSVVEKTFTVCRSENECLLQEINLKSAEATTVRTYASFCSEEAKKLRSELAAHRHNEAVLEKRLTSLESESALMRNEMGRGISEFADVKDKKESLEQRILQASRVVEQLKEEILTLTKGMLALQREINTEVDKIMLCLGLDAKSVASSRSRSRQDSIDSNCTSTQTEGSSDELSSEISDTYTQKLSSSCRLFPDQECFVNPSDVSVMRENKSEIRRLHEELRSKIFAIKDTLSRVHDSPMPSNLVKKGSGKPSHEFKAFVENESFTSNCKGSSVMLPRLSKAERVKLSSLLTTLKEELMREKERNNDARLGCDANDICSLYDNLEGKLSRLSCELASKEDEISNLLTERTRLEEELNACERGLTICRHCSAKVPDAVLNRTKQLKDSLLAHMQDTARLEAEIFDFMEYRHQLEGELYVIKGQITDLEEELAVRKILMERGINCKVVMQESELPKDDRDELNSSSSGKKRKSEKHVTFESVDSELDKIKNKRRRQKPEKCPAAPNNTEPPSKLACWRQADLDSSVIDLCELLNSIPRDIPKKLPTQEELEIAERANRLSGYDNMSYDDKIEYATKRKKSETVVAKTILSNNTKPALNGERNHKVGVDYGDDGLVTCQLCGLFKKRT